MSHRWMLTVAASAAALFLLGGCDEGATNEDVLDDTEDVIEDRADDLEDMDDELE